MRKGSRVKTLSLLLFLSGFLATWQLSGGALAMHISEGILPVKWSALWFIAALPFLIPGFLSIYREIASDRAMVAKLALAGALVFVISLLPIPVPISGTCSHPCGTPLAALLIGPTMTSVMASMALLLQALFLAHGGLTTLGANVFSMGVVGALSGLFVYRLSRRLGAGQFLSAFLAGFLGDLFVYLATAFQLASGVPSGRGFLFDLGRICLAFLPTQLPLAILEGLFTGGILLALARSRPEILAPTKGGEKLRLLIAPGKRQ